MKRWIGILLMVIPLLGQAQIAAPDNAAIEVAIRDVGSLYYYPALMQRYQRGDSLLGRQEYRHLYYGYQFDPNYTPRETIPQLDSVLMIVRHVPNISLDQCRELIRYGTEVMEKDPFNPQVLNTMTYAYGRLGDFENERRSARRFDGVMMAIISSGEGSEEKSPWHILYFSHAQDVLGYLGVDFLQPIVVGWLVEYYPLVKRQGQVRGYYFDYSRIYARQPAEPTDPQPRRWQLNGTPIN